MGIFDDKKFGKLDWMTQITETIQSELNDILAKLPDRTEISVDDIAEQCHGENFHVYHGNIVRNILHKDFVQVSWEEERAIMDCFELEATSPLEFNLETNTLTGTITLVKKQFTFRDEELQKMMGVNGIRDLNNVKFKHEWPLDRLNEILDVLGNSEECQKNRAYTKKMDRIMERLREIFANNEWRIRDTELANRMCRWIKDYIQVGNLAALTNLCKLKVMTHHNMPIYSIEEER